MGIVFSCLASACMLIGELASTLFLAIGEVGSLLARGLFGLIVGICDVLAACMCCCQVPFSQRPDREGYTYTTLAVKNKAGMVNKTKFSNASFAAIPKSVGDNVQKQAESETQSESEDGVVSPTQEKASEEGAVGVPAVAAAAATEKQDKAAVKAKEAEEKKAKKMAASEEKKAKKAEVAAAKLAKKEAKNKKVEAKTEEVKEEQAEPATTAVEEVKATNDPTPAPGWFNGWFSAAPAAQEEKKA